MHEAQRKGHQGLPHTGAAINQGGAVISTDDYGGRTYCGQGGGELGKREGTEVEGHFEAIKLARHSS